MAHKDKTKHTAYNRAWRLAHPEQVRDNSRAHAEDRRAYKRTHRKEENARKLAYIQSVFRQALRVLGNKCACPGCGVAEPLFLTIDHINGRPEGPKKAALLEAKASGWDKTQFQILCMNCNFVKRDRGFCPVHQKDPGQRNGHNPVASAQQALWPRSS